MTSNAAGSVTVSVAPDNAAVTYTAAQLLVSDDDTSKVVLLGLDGNPIEIKEGAIGVWVPYMRLKDAQGEYTGNGAVVDEDDDGNLSLSLYFTDNQLGDLNLADGEFFDPGIMYSLVAAESPTGAGQPGQANPAASQLPNQSPNPATNRLLNPAASQSPNPAANRSPNPVCSNLPPWAPPTAPLLRSPPQGKQSP